MHKRSQVLLIFLTSSLLAPSLEALTRPEALELLKASVESSLPHWPASLRTEIWIPDGDDENKTERILAQQLFGALVADGILRGPTTRPHELAWEPGVDHFYWPNAGPDIESGQEPKLVLRASNGTISEVTGIAADGPSHADVECVVLYTPTPTFQIVNQRIALYRAQGRRWLEGYFIGWPEAQQLYVKETRRYRLRRFDDGWRVERFVASVARENVPPQSTEAVQPPGPASNPTSRPSSDPLQGATSSFEIPSLGNYSDGYYQLELWLDRSSGGAVIGLFSLLSDSPSGYPAVGQLSAVVGDGRRDALRFTATMKGGDVTFDGLLRDGTLEGTLRSPDDAVGRKTSFDRLERQYEKSYATRAAWEKYAGELLACCGPRSTDQRP